MILCFISYSPFYSVWGLITGEHEHRERSLVFPFPEELVALTSLLSHVGH